VPFVVTIPDADRDPMLKEKLALELPGILNWAIAGCLRWQREGLRVPQCVKAATAAYRAEEDVIGQFLAENTEAAPLGRAGRAELYQRFQSWAVGEGIKNPLKAKSFNRQVEERGIQLVKSTGIHVWLGINLVPNG
jgi:putative DNA primase/helicase